MSVSYKLPSPLLVLGFVFHLVSSAVFSVCPTLLEVNAGKYVSIDGTLFTKEDIVFSPYSSTSLYGTGAFDTARVYRHSSGRLAAFRLTDHLERLSGACLLAGVPLTQSVSKIRGDVASVVKANAFGDSFIRVSVFLGEGPVGLLLPADAPKNTLVLNWEWGQYHGAESALKGIKAHLSRFRRQHGEEANAKFIGNYAMATVARGDADRKGFQEAILEDEFGNIAEATGENIFMVKDGKLITPPRGAILLGVTRSSVQFLASRNSISHSMEAFNADTLLSADEVFLTGTAAELVPVVDIDGKKIGNGMPGPVTRLLQAEYQKLVRGEIPNTPPEWFTFIE